MSHSKQVVLLNKVPIYWNFTVVKVRHPRCVRIIMIQDNNIYNYIYIQSINTTNHIRAICKKQLHVSA